MPRILVELTDRCNLSCRHCFTGRHGGSDDLPLDILNEVLAEAEGHGFDELGFTGGEPTLHKQFIEVVRLTHAAGYKFGFVTNGLSFVALYPQLLPYRDRLTGVTFSLDGAAEETHDRQRGRGTYRRVMQAVSVCLVEEIPFTVNMVVTADNRHELERMAEKASKLGFPALRFGQVMPTPLTVQLGLDLSPWERKVVEAEVAELRQRFPVPITMAVGYHTSDLFPCRPLKMKELNVDCRGNLTACCALSGHGNGVADGDVIGNLREMGFGEALERLRVQNAEFRRLKLEHLKSDEFGDSDFFACWYCSVHYGKVDWLRPLEAHPWARLVRRNWRHGDGRPARTPQEVRSI